MDTSLIPAAVTERWLRHLIGVCFDSCAHIHTTAMTTTLCNICKILLTHHTTAFLLLHVALYLYNALIAMLLWP